MGAQQSKPAAALNNEKLVMERLRSFQLQEAGGDDDSYVHISSSEKARPSTSPKLAVSTVGKWEHELLQDPKNRLALSALSGNNPKTVLTSRAAGIVDRQIFNIKIPFEGAPITNQNHSGRCWLFA